MLGLFYFWVAIWVVFRAQTSLLTLDLTGFYAVFLGGKFAAFLVGVSKLFCWAKKQLIELELQIYKLS